MDIDRDRLRRDIEANAAFGAIETSSGSGRTVLTGSAADKQCRDRLIDRFDAMGMEVRIDPVGNIVGRWTPPSADPDAPPVAAGSHLDSVPEGGIFDGPLGVYGALEAVRTISERSIDLVRPIDVVSFTEEEGSRFGIGVLGSSVAAGIRSVEEALALEDDTGTSLGSYLDRIGYRGSDSIRAADWFGWTELHIEQGTHLESSDTDVGVVDAISGLTNCRVEITGETNHAGTTPMAERADALTAASVFILELEAVARDLAVEYGPSTVGTVGKLAVEPGAKNTIPGRVVLTTDVRSVDAAAIETLVSRITSIAADIESERPVTVTVDRYRDTKPTALGDRAVGVAIDVVESLDISWDRMYSAAIHDTATVGTATDAVLLFAPSRGGISHSPSEWTDWEACGRATDALAGTIAELASMDS